MDYDNFNALKQKQINFLKDGTPFKDYPFAGSRMNVLLTATTHATYMMQAFSQYTMRESFLETALDIRNVVMHAQNRGYPVRGKRGATTNIQLILEDTVGNNVITIPRGTMVNGGNYTFTSIQDISAVKNSSNQFIVDAKFVQGELTRKFHQYNDKDITITDLDCDTSTIKVLVNGAEWIYSANSLNGNNKFFVRFNYDLFPVIYFDPDNKPALGDTVEISFIKTDSAGNTENLFTLASTIPNAKLFSIHGDMAMGAYGFDTVADIKSNITFYTIANNRAVTARDYEAIITNKFGNYIDNIVVTGGNFEAFIAINPSTGNVLPLSIKNEIIDYLREYMLPQIRPVIIDPDYITVTLDVHVDTKSSNNIRRDIIQGIETYFSNYVDSFGKSFHKSKLLSVVDASSPDILGSDCEFTISVDAIIDGVTDTIKGNFHNPISTFKSSTFKFISSLNQNALIDVSVIGKENGDVIIGGFDPLDDISASVYEVIDGKHYYRLGNVNYATGEFTLSIGGLGVNLARFPSATVRMSGTPIDSDIYSARSYIITYDRDNINITLHRRITT